ncbi:MAG: prolyl oligopeptidase family serine peptidase [Opitutaceae bacterium]|nr:prolyl oligopeptidase family serine peptidase [Opitutaceae bacterium]
MTLRQHHCLWIISALAFVTFCWGAKSKELLSGRKVDTLFRAYEGDAATLSRDGRTLACILRNERQLAVGLIDLDHREKPRSRILIDEKADAEVTHLVWASDHQLVLVSAAPAIHCVDLSTQRSRRVLDSTSFNDPESTSPRPPRYIGLVPDEPGFVWVEGISRIPSMTAMDFEMDAAGSLATDPSSATDDEGLSQLQTDPETDLYNMEVDQTEATRDAVKWVELVKLDLATGKTKSLSNLSVSLDATILYDRQGKPRILQEQATLKQRFRVRNPKRSLFSQWLDLDRIVGKEHPLDFNVTPQNYLAHRSFPMAFDTNPDWLYYASNIGRDTYAVFQLNLKDRSIREIAAPVDGFDLADPGQPMSDRDMILDRTNGLLLGIRRLSPFVSTLWIDPMFATAEREIRRKFPGRTVEIIEADDARERFLTLVTSPSDPGRLFVYLRGTGECLECLRRAPWLKREEANTTRIFDFVSRSGNHVSGRLTLPRATLLNPSPLVVWCGPGPGAQIEAGFGREGQVFADLGCMVLEVDYRGSGGRGVAHRQAIMEAFDRVPLEDILEAMEWLPSVRPFDARRVAIGGSGFGGFLALRALELHPRTFRCAVAVNAPTRLDQLAEEPANERMEEMRRFNDQTQAYMKAMTRWKPGQGRMPTMPIAEPRPVNFQLEFNRWLYDHGKTRMGQMSVTGDVKLITRPVLLLHDPDSPSVSFDYVKSLKRTLSRQGVDCELKEISGGFAAGSLASRGTAFDAIGEFVADQFYKFDVEVGEAKEQR